MFWLFSNVQRSFNIPIDMYRYRPDTVSVALSYQRDLNANLTAEAKRSAFL